MASKRCFVNVVRQKDRREDRLPNQVQWIEMPKCTPILEDVGSKAEDKSVEELVKVPIDQDGTRYFMLGSDLSNPERNDLVFFPQG